MDATSAGEADLKRLKSVQYRVRELARNHHWFADAIRASFKSFLELGERHTMEQSALIERARRLARDLLQTGRLSDRDSTPSGMPLAVRVDGLCPSDLAERLQQTRPTEAMPVTLEREGATAALAAMDVEDVRATRDMTDLERSEEAAAIASGTHVSYTWRILVPIPADWKEPADPLSLARADLERFSDADYRTIALHHLGGLADVGALRPIVPRPRTTGDVLADASATLAWRFRLPIFEEDQSEDQPRLNLRALPAAVAEQMLDDVESWARAEAASRGEALSAGTLVAAPGVARPTSAPNRPMPTDVTPPSHREKGPEASEPWRAPSERLDSPPEVEAIQRSVNALWAFLNEGVERVGNSGCPSRDLLEEVLETLASVRVVFANMPEDEARVLCEDFWHLLETPLQYDVAGCLIRLGCDPLPWTRFVAHPTRERCNDAYATCEAASAIAWHHLLNAKGTKRDRSSAEAPAPQPQADTSGARLSGAEASERSGLGTETIRAAAKRNKWTVVRRNRQNHYLVSDLKHNWPSKNFDPLANTGKK